MEQINITLQELNWDYPFLPKGNDYSYYINVSKKTIIAERITKVGTFKAYETMIDKVDFKLLKDKA